eukprot:6975741-Pyramimonas_sp.AAC.1
MSSAAIRPSSCLIWPVSWLFASAAVFANAANCPATKAENHSGAASSMAARATLSPQLAKVRLDEVAPRGPAPKPSRRGPSPKTGPS